MENRLWINYEDKMGISTTLSSGPVIAKIFTDTCPTCKMVDETVKELSEKRPDIRVLNIDGQKCPDIIRWLSVRNVPKIYIMFNDGFADNFVEYTENVVTGTADQLIAFHDAIVEAKPEKEDG